MVLDADIFEMELKHFEHDVHILIQGTLFAGLEKLSQQTDAQLAEILALSTRPRMNHERLSDVHVDTLATYGSQTTFLRNQALVALTSRLFMALRDMAKHALTFSPRNPEKNGRYPGKSEWNRLWREYEERFRFDFKQEANRIAFIKPMVEARDRVVHHGAEANPIGDDGVLNTSFSDSNPQYVHGEGNAAEVRVSEELLRQNVQDSVELVRWISQRLRQMELAQANGEPKA
jgi:hypothetical protein